MLWNTKKGSYILEASIALPIFIIGILILSSIIGIVSRCENAAFILADEAQRYQYEFIPENIEDRICREAKVRNVGVNRSGYTFKLDMEAGPNTVMDINSKVRFNLNLYARPFIGATRMEKKESLSTFGMKEKYVAVYIFPNSGKKFHKRGCTYVNSYYSRVRLTEKIMRKYKSCRSCKSSKAKVGDMVYLFEYGKDYHLRKCKTIDKYVIEMDRKDAINKGYTPCSKCGG
ncbi:MAG: hypothetical protein MJ146_01075 [Clostridia bacterium]|nr:hypothetical protein [Clostridia bacterium]